MFDVDEGIVTSGDEEYVFQPFASGFLVFRALAVGGLRVALASTQNEDSPLYEVHIGIFDNTKTAIQKNHRLPYEAVVETPYIPNVPGLYFELRWYNGHIDLVKRVGDEAVSIIAWRDPEPIGVGYFGKSCGILTYDDDAVKDARAGSDSQYTWTPMKRGSFTLDVRCPHDAYLALICGPRDSDPTYEVLLGGCGNSISAIWSRGDKRIKVREFTPALLSGDGFRRFTVSWAKERILVKDGFGRVIVRWESAAPIDGVSRIGLRSARGSSGHWVLSSAKKPARVQSDSAVAQQMALPGWFVNPRCSAEEARWVQCQQGAFPSNAVTAGLNTNQEQLYLARAVHEDDLIPGQLVPSRHKCFVPWGGLAHGKTNYEVLCGCFPVWMPSANGRVPPGALTGGHTEGGTETLYIGRATLLNGVMIVGKVQPSHNVCYVPYEGQEQVVHEYEVLCA